jgi:hypothetical protein
VEDLPPGFALSPPDEESDDEGEDSHCESHDPSKVVPSAAEKEISFQKDMFGPFVVETIAQYSGTDEAKRYMTEVRKLLDVCGSFEDRGRTNHQGHHGKDVDKKGDETVAIKIHIVGAFPIGGDLVFVGQDNLVFLVGHVGMGGIDTDDTETLVSQAERKLSSIL